MQNATTPLCLLFVILSAAITIVVGGPGCSNVFFLNQSGSGFSISQLNWSTGQAGTVTELAGTAKADNYNHAFYGGFGADAVHSVLNFAPLHSTSPYSTVFTTNLTTFETHAVNLTNLLPNSTVQLVTWDPYAEQMVLLARWISSEKTMQSLAFYYFDPMTGDTKFLGNESFSAQNLITVVSFTSDGQGRLYALLQITPMLSTLTNTTMMIIDQTNGGALSLVPITNTGPLQTWSAYNPQLSAKNNMITFTVIGGTLQGTLSQMTYDLGSNAFAVNNTSVITPLIGCIPDLQSNILSSDGLIVYAIDCYFNYLYQISTQTARVITSTTISSGYIWGVVIN